MAIAMLLMGPAISMAAGNNLPQYEKGQILVSFKSGVTASQITGLNATNAVSIIKYFKTGKIHQLKLPAGLNVQQAVKAYKASALIEFAEPNYYRYLQAAPNDPGYAANMWGLNNIGQTGGTINADINAPEAWNITTGSSAVIVADIDSGMDMTHPDLVANVWVNLGEIPGNGIDDDGNGYIDDVHGWDFGENDNDPSDTIASCGGHGTHTAGTIGASGNNGVGVTGVNWAVSLMPLKIFNPIFGGLFCTASSSAIIGAVNYASMMGARVSNNSYGGGPASLAEQNAIQASKALFVAAAGNDGLSNDITASYPATYPLDNIISVAATDHNDVQAVFSNFGVLTVDLAAPGVHILSTLPNNTYNFYDGTSMAAPHVTGAAALLLAQNPNLTINELKRLLLDGVDPIPGLPVLTGGRLNIFTSLTFNQTPADVTVALTPVSPTTVVAGDIITYNIALTNNSAVSQTFAASVYAQSPNGNTRPLQGPLNVTIPAGGVVNKAFSLPVPTGTSPGVYTLFGQADSVTSFDEDPLAYTVN